MKIMEAKMKKIRASIILAVTISLMFLVGCGKKEKLPAQIAELAAKKDGSVVRLGIYGDPMELVSIANHATNHGQMACNFVHAAPLAKDASGAYVPNLFSNFVVSPGASGTVSIDAGWKYGLKWHDGKPFDAKDLKYTIEQMKKAENKSPYLQMAQGFKRVDTFGGGVRTRIVLANDSRCFLDLLTVGLIPSHIVGTHSLYVAKLPTGNASAANKLYAEFPVGLGKYKVAARKPGFYLLLESAFDSSLPKVLIKSYWSYEQLVSDFRNDKLDWMNIPSAIAEQLETMKIEKAVFTRYKNPAHLVWMFNTKKGALADKRVRKALDLLTVRKDVLAQMPYGGKFLESNPFIEKPEIGSMTVEARVAKAKELLTEAGITDSNNDGVLEYQNAPFELKVSFNDDNLARRMVSEKIVEALKAVGVKASVDAVSWAELVKQRLQNKSFDTCLISLQLPEHGNWVGLFHSSPAPYENLNFTGISNSELDSALSKLDSVLPGVDFAKERTTVGEILDEERPVAFLFNPNNVGVTKAETGKAYVDAPIWDSILNWKAFSAVSKTTDL